MVSRRGGVRHAGSGAGEDDGGRAADGHAPPRGTGAGRERGRPAGGAKRRTGSLTPYKATSSRLRHRLHHAGGRVCRPAGHDGLRPVVVLRRRPPVGAARARDAEAGREPVGQGGARRGDDPGHRAAADQALRRRVRAHARALRRPRSDAGPSVHRRTARSRRPTPSTKGCTCCAADAIGPHCGTVTLEVYSEKAPDKRETATIDPTVAAADLG